MKTKAKTAVNAENTGINVPLLCKVCAGIEAYPKSFDMSQWHDIERAPKTLEEPTGWACIAGWSVAFENDVLLDDLEGPEIQRRASRLLGLTAEQAACLFYLGMWPMEIQKAYCAMPVTLEDFENNARLACERIEIFIKTKGER